ncbi:MAG: hypothetical protein AB7U83_03875 [Vicinamibacterales bacterium]
MHAPSWLMSLSLSVVLAACGSGGPDRSNDRFAGTWALDVEKSTYAPAPGPKAQTIVITGNDQARKVAVDVTPAIGPAMHWEVAGAVNQDLPVTGVNPNADTYRFRRVSPTTVEARYSVKSKPTITQTAVLSPDGNTMTITGKGTNVAGQVVNTVAVFARQPGS